MPFLVECILCRQKLRLPDNAAGASVQCPRCGSHFTAAPEENLTPAARRAESSSLAARAAAPPAVLAPLEAPPVAEPALAAPSLPQPTRRLPILPAARPAPSRRDIDPIGAGAIALAGLAGWCTVVFALTLLVIPLAVLGLLASLVALAVALFSDAPRWTLATIGGVGNAVLLLAALFFPAWLGGTYQLSRERGEPEVVTPRVVALPGKTPPAGQPTPEWPDATQFSVQLKDVRIELLSAEVRPLEIATTPRKKVTKDSYLVLRLRTHQRAGGAEFASEAWGQGGTAQERRQPLLTDEAGKSYGPAPANLGGEAVTLTTRSSNFPLGITDEVYLFEAPTTTVNHLRLEIPATGWGGTGSVRFAIPRSMLKTAAPRAAEKAS